MPDDPDGTPASTPRRRVVGEATRVGLRATPLKDLYYHLMRGSWAQLIALFVVGYVVVNLGFAALYMLDVPGFAGDAPAGFADAFFFSVQTIATIGYGVLAPRTVYVNVLVAIESLLGVLGFAVATGLVFSKFARPSARVLFSSVMVVTRRNGKPCLQLRCANARGNDLVEATAHVVVIKNDVTAEGHRMRRFHDLALDRDRSPLFVLTWLIMHDLDERSPLYGATAESLAADDALFVVTIVGVDGTLGQTVHARHSYEYFDVRFAHRFVDVLTTDADRRLTLDFARFHDTERDPSMAIDSAVAPGGPSSS